MENIKTEEAMKELTLILLYLSRFTQGEKFHVATVPFQIGIYYGKRHEAGKGVFIQVRYKRLETGVKK